MRQKAKYFTYPVLAKDSNCYKSSNFNTTVEIEQDMHKIKLMLKAELNNVELEKLLQQGAVAIACHVECPQTCYRKMFMKSEDHYDFTIDENELNGTVEVSTFLVSVQDIPEFTSEDFLEEYQNLKFNLDRGLRLAIGRWIKFVINKSNNDFADNPSIFTIIRELGNQKEIRVDYDTDKIQVHLPEKAFTDYNALARMPQYMKVLHSMLLVPALVKVFTDLKNDLQNGYTEENNEGYQDSHWYISLKNVYNKYGRDFEDVIQNGDPFEEAQKLLDSPIVNGLSEMTTVGDMDED